MRRLLVIDSCLECPFISYKIRTHRNDRVETCSKLEDKQIEDVSEPPPDWCPLPEDKFGVPDGTVLSLSEGRVISLYNKDGGETGKISFGEKSITFKGEIDKSADALFGLLKYVVDKFIKR